ncbi:MAG: hypothetical protein Kow0077_19880 [Anaerolineae bacterium]
MDDQHNCCENLEKCPIFKYFRKYAQQVYIDIYCQGDYSICKRYQLRQAGQPVPENLMPHGGTLWDTKPA